MVYRNLAQGLDTPIVAFDGDRLLAQGAAGDVARIVKRHLESSLEAQILIFDDATSLPAEIDFEGTDEETLRFIASWGQIAARPGPTRLMAREVTLLPRHWEWLDEQPGGASSALRRLVDEARKGPKDTARRAQEAAYRFVLAMAGDREGFEEATRALFASDAERFAAASEGWPPDVRSRSLELVRRIHSEHE